MFLSKEGDATSTTASPPTPVEAGEAGLAGQELLHGGLFEVALLGDEPIQSVQQRIHIAQRRRDGALFGEVGEERGAQQRLLRNVVTRWSLCLSAKRLATLDVRQQIAPERMA